MRGYNKAIIMGNLARDPEVRYTGSQKAVASFSVAVSRSWRDQTGETREEVAFIPVVVWGRAAEVCERYLKKGSGVLVEGRISVRSYEDKTGAKRYVTEIVSESFQFVGGGQNSGQNGGQNRPQLQQPQENQRDKSMRDLLQDYADATDGEVVEEADIPF